MTNPNKVIFKQICALIEKAPQDFQERLNLITDIDTKNIREGYEQEALDLLKDLKDFEEQSQGYSEMYDYFMG